MKIVIQTQICENYGAHSWNGEGECPQYWKFKGGNTYVVHDVSIAENMSSGWWYQLEKSIVSRSEMFEEYIISSVVVDEIDFDESDYVDEWDSPINLCFAQGRFLATRHSKFDYVSDGIVGKLEQWVQEEGDREDYVLMYERENSTFVTYKEWLAEKEAA